MRLSPAQDAVEPTISVSVAHHTLTRGALFLSARPFTTRIRNRGDLTPFEARRVGNGLRELDGFLCVLMDSLAARIGIELPQGEDVTAGKLEGLVALHCFDPAVRVRLEALRRSRDCLYDDRGLVAHRHLGRSGRFTVGWPETPRRYRGGETLTITFEELVEICAFYREIGDRLLRASDHAPGIAAQLSDRSAGAAGAAI